MNRIDLFILLYYLVVWGGCRLRGAVRRWRQPLLLGREWFFNVPVEPTFYVGAGRRILLAYRLRMLGSFVIETPIAAALIVSGHVRVLVWLIVAMAISIHIIHVFSVDLAERQSQKLASSNTGYVSPAISLSLEPRRLANYSNRNMELGMALIIFAVVGWLIHYCLLTPAVNLRLVISGPASFLYMHLGFLIAKVIVVQWRSPVPQHESDLHMKAREAARKMYLSVCDIGRCLNTLGLLFWPVVISARPNDVPRFTAVWLTMMVVLTIVVIVWQEVARDRVLRLSLQTRPVRLPDLLAANQTSRWPLCYEPSAPMLVLRGVHGYSLNLANSLVQFGAAYVSAFPILLVVLRSRQ